jgi:hypothetical protein
MLDDITDKEGGSLFGNIGKAFKKVAPIAKVIAKNPIVKQIAKKALTNAVTMGTTALTGNPMAGQMVGQMTSPQPTTTGTGFFDAVKKQAINIAKSEGKKLAKKAIEVGAQKLQQKVSGEGILDVVKSVAKKEGKKLVQKGIQLGAQKLQQKISGTGLLEEDQGYGLGGKRLMNSPFIQSNDIHARMAHLRSLRKVKGGSMIGL